MARPRKYDFDRIRDLYAAGHSYEYIVGVIGCGASVITQALAEEDTDNDGVDDLSGARCRCGLRLPCDSCLTDNHAYTRGPGRVLPESPVVDANEINEACDRFQRRHDSR